MKKILKNVDADKQQQHSRLMDEFRKAHRRMFKGAEDGGAAEDANDDNDNAVSAFQKQKVVYWLCHNAKHIPV